MAVHQLAREPVQNVVDRKRSLLFRHFRIEEHLQQQVAEFAGKFLPVTIVDGFENFVGFLKRVGLDGIEGLFAVPGTASGGPQSRHDGDCAFKTFAGSGHWQPL